MDAIKLPVEEPREVTIRTVWRDNVDPHWSLLCPMVVAALEGDRSYTVEDVYDWLVKGRAFGLVVEAQGRPSAAMVALECAYPQRKTLCVVTLGGEGWRRWSGTLQAELERLMRARGYDALECHTRRPGMVRWLEELGWRRDMVSLEWRDDGEEG